MPKAVANREPRTKQELLSRILSMDFSGDLRTLSPNGAQLKRTAPNKLEVMLPTSGKKFELVVRRPKSEEHLSKLRAKLAKTAKKNGAKVPVVKPTSGRRNASAH